MAPAQPREAPVTVLRAGPTPAGRLYSPKWLLTYRWGGTVLPVTKGTDGGKNGMSVSRFGAAMLLATLGSVAICQTPQTDTVAFYAQFFFRVSWLEGQANKLESQGKDGTFLRSTMRRQVGLTAQEEAALKSVALDWSAKDAASIRAARTLISTGATPPGSQQLLDIRSSRQAATLDHITQLQTAMGPARFHRLDGFVRLTCAPSGPRPAPQPQGSPK